MICFTRYTVVRYAVAYIGIDSEVRFQKRKSRSQIAMSLTLKPDISWSLWRVDFGPEAEFLKST